MNTLTKKEFFKSMRHYKNVNLRPSLKYYNFISLTKLMLDLKFNGMNLIYDKETDRCYSTETSKGWYTTLPTEGDVLKVENLFMVKFHPLMDGVCLFNIFVNPEYRRMNVGSSIMDIICEISDKLKIPIYLIPSDYENVPRRVLANFYHSFGFRANNDSVYWNNKNSYSQVS